MGRSTVLLPPKRLRERAGIFAALLGVAALVCGVTIGVLTLDPHRRSP